MHLLGDIINDWRTAGWYVPDGLDEWGAKLTPEETWSTCQRVDWMLLWLTRTPWATSKEPLVHMAMQWALRAFDSASIDSSLAKEIVDIAMAGIDETELAIWSVVGYGDARIARGAWLSARRAIDCENALGIRSAAVAVHDAAILAAAAIDLAIRQAGVAQSVMADELRAVVPCPRGLLRYGTLRNA